MAVLSQVEKSTALGILAYPIEGGLEKLHYAQVGPTHGAVIESLPGVRSAVYSLAVDDIMLCDLYVPSELSSAQHLRDEIAPVDLLSSLSSASFWWIAAFLLLLLLRTAYDEVAASTSQEGLGLRYYLRQGEEDYGDFHREPERNRKLNIVNKDSKSAIRKDVARIGIECRFWSRAGIH